MSIFVFASEVLNSCRGCVKHLWPSPRGPSVALSTYREYVAVCVW